jgi:superfamily II DNA or RNA helicase
MFIEREYQTKCENAIFEAWKKFQSTLVEMATGCGKTIIFAKVIKTMAPKRALVLAHRNELIVQAKEKIEAVTGLSCQIEKAEQYASTNVFDRSPVVVSSIQSQISGDPMHRRYMRFKRDEFGVVIADECHHSTSASWKEVINYYLSNKETKLLGVTATADRSDGAALGQMFQSCAFKYGILDAINDGWLVDITQQFVQVKSLDFSHIRTTCGDLNEGDLAKVMEAEENIQGVCQPTLEAIFGLAPKTLSAIPVPQWREYLKSLNKVPRRTIVFTVSVAQAEMCANIFLRAMDGVEWVCGETNKQKRADILKRFLIGETSVVVNCGVLTEGYDNPQVELISVARPTKSRSLYCQIIGRSTRTLPGIVDGIPTAGDRRKAIADSAKPFCRILDFVGNSGRHKLVSCVDALGGHVSEAAAEAAKKKAMDGGKPVRIMITMTNAEIELERKQAEAAERARLEKEARRSHLVAKSNYSTQDVNPFGNTSKIPFTSRVSRDGRAFSDKQCKVLRIAGCDPNKVAYRQGQAIIAKQIAKWQAEKEARTLA